MSISTESVRPSLLLTRERYPGAWRESFRARLARSCQLLQPISLWCDFNVRAPERFPELRPSKIESAVAGAAPAPRFLTASVASELGILLALSVMFPFLIHILPVPEDARLGPRLLPIFYAPLLAALLGRTLSALMVAVAAPWLNWALTSHPAPQGALVMMLQLLVFVCV